MNIPSAIYSALSTDATVQSYIADDPSGGKAIYTKRPLPEDAGYPLILSAGDVSIDDNDYLNSDLPEVVRDVVVYGKEGHYRDVENCAYYLREKFHRKPDSISVIGYQTVKVTVFGPIVGPVDDDAHCSRIITLTIQLRKT